MVFHILRLGDVVGGGCFYERASPKDLKGKSMERVRLGIIGTSGWSEMMYLKTLSGHTGAEIVALCGRDPNHTAEVAARYGIPNVHTHAEAMIAAGGLDAVIVAAPDDYHFPMSIAALSAGLDVLCEKPLANNAADAWTMQRVAKAARRRTMVLFTWRWQPHFRHLKALLDAGAVGRPRRAELGFRAGFARDRAYHWRLDARRANGTAADLGAHMIDMGRWLFGEVGSVSATLATIVDRSGIPGHEQPSANDAATLLLDFVDGPEVVIDVSAATPMGDRFVEHRIRVEGDAGTIELDYVFSGADAGLSFRMATGDGPFETVIVPAAYYGASDPKGGAFDIYGSEPVGARYFVDCLLDGRDAAPDFFDGARAQDIIDAALRSHREGRRVALV